MGVCGENRNQNKMINKTKNDIIFSGHKQIPVNISNKVMKSICKIKVNDEEGESYGTGFFLNFTNSLKCLITNYHIIYQILENENIIIEIHNKKIMRLKFNNRYTKYLKKPKDITMIEIKESDNIYNDIEFLDYNNNYIDRGYIIYDNIDIFSIEHPYGDDALCASGKIIKINEYEFEHDISTDDGSSGCPIILLNNNIKSIQVIGIHKKSDHINKLNDGIFIGEILDKEMNYIIAEINIKDEDLNKDIRIINSYEKYIRNYGWKIDKEENKNEDEIKKCEIEINDKLIKFNYFHKFKSKGKYIIKYTFNNNITKTCFMFKGCFSLKNIDLSNFNTNNVTNMGHMFSGCSSITNIYLSNFNTNNVINMEYMFSGCSSLTNINLSNFNTNNVNNMKNMFSGCSSLTNINLSNFNTRNVTNIDSMFSGCSSLININLPNLKTNNVTDMKCMFSNCSSLTNIDLSNFNTCKVTDMSSIFLGCSSLKYIDLSSFNTSKVTYMGGMFSYCSSITNINLSNLNTNNVTNMGHMFSGCSSLTNINLSNFNTRKVSDMGSMFENCSSLTNINLSNFNTEEVTNMKYMFKNCSSLSKIDLSNFNTRKVTNMGSMFENCSSLTKIDLSNFNTWKVTDMGSMFENCSSLTYINLSYFYTRNNAYIGLMFYKCYSLRKKNVITFNEKILNNINYLTD